MSCDNVVAMAPFNTPSDRYRSLVRQLGEERDFRYGWRSEVARLLEVHPSYISRIASGEEVNVGKDAIERAMRGLEIASRYFYDDALTDPNYKRFTTSAGQAGQPTPLGEKLVSDADVAVEHAQWSALFELATRAIDLGRAESDETIAAARKLAEAVLSLQMVRIARATMKHCDDLAKAPHDQRAELVEAVSVAGEVLGLAVRQTAIALAMEPPGGRGAPERPRIHPSVSRGHKKS